MSEPEKMEPDSVSAEKSPRNLSITLKDRIVNPLSLGIKTFDSYHPGQYVTDLLNKGWDSLSVTRTRSLLITGLVTVPLIIAALQPWNGLAQTLPNPSSPAIVRSTDRLQSLDYKITSIYLPYTYTETSGSNAGKTAQISLENASYGQSPNPTDVVICTFTKTMTGVNPVIFQPQFSLHNTRLSAIGILVLDNKGFMLVEEGQSQPGWSAGSIEVIEDMTNPADYSSGARTVYRGSSIGLPLPGLLVDAFSDGYIGNDNNGNYLAVLSQNSADPSQNGWRKAYLDATNHPIMPFVLFNPDTTPTVTPNPTSIPTATPILSRRALLPFLSNAKP